MSSDARRILSQFDSRDSPQLYQYYAEGPLRSRFSSPSIIITAALLAFSIVYQAAARGHGRLPSLPQLLWDASLSVIPARLLFAIDRVVNPPLFPTPMVKVQPTRAAKNDALRRILGLDNGGGILGSVSQAGRKGFSSLSSAAIGGRAVGDSPPGLGNYDNSCYQNSILQGLASLRTLPTYLSAISLEKRLDLSPTRTVATLGDLLAKLSGPSSNGQTLWTPPVLKNMSTWQQQDAQEYYSKLLDQIDNEIAKAARALQDAAGLEPDNTDDDSSTSQHSNDSGYHSVSAARSKPEPKSRLARNPLEGLMAQRVACVNCGYCEGLTMIPFNCLTLTLGNLPEHDLYERLDHYTKVEPIEGVECPKCSLLMCRELVKTLVERTGDSSPFRPRLQILEEALEDEAFDEETLTEKCNIPAKMRASSTKTKQVALARAPHSLVFHVNRSGFDESTGYMFKNSAAVRFPVVFDLGPWCLGSADGTSDLQEGGVAVQDVEQWTLDAKASMVAGDHGPSRITGPLYELRAVVTHYGHHENGHYICYRKHPVSSPPTQIKSEGAEEASDPESQDDAHNDRMELDHETRPASEAKEPTPGQDEPQSQWWRLSDENVTRVDEQTVLAQGGVFMLFYDCVDPNPAPAARLDQSVEAECATRETASPDVVPAFPLAAEDLSIVSEDEDALADSGVLMDIDDVLPVPGTPVATAPVPEILVSEIAGDVKPAMASHDCASGAREAAGDQGQDTGDTACVREATDFCRPHQPLEQLPGV
jgi:ubiquitin carboxyl-terminal hydrolase 1